MNRDEALAQLESIQEALEASHDFVISAPLAFAYGLGVLLIPLIEWQTQKMSFGTIESPLTQSIIRVLTFIFLFGVLRFSAEKLWPEHVTKPAHPVVRHFMTFHKPVLVAMVSTVLILGYHNQLDLAGPIVLVILGTLFNIYGQLAGVVVKAISWSYIVLGVAFGFLASPEHPHLWMVFTVYVGLSFMAIGASLKKGKTSRA